MSRLAVAVLAAALSAAVTTGCGGSGDTHRRTSASRPSPTPTPTPTAATTPSSSGSSGASGGKPGWGPTGAYVGRYRQVGGSGSADRLTLFMRTVFEGQPPVPSGILALHDARSGNSVLYLTDLAHRGGRRVAAVRSGSFDGPIVGRLATGGAASGRLAAALRLSDQPRQLVFRRFSRNPHP